MADPLTEKIIGAAIEVYRVLGPGLLELIYAESEFGVAGRMVLSHRGHKGHRGRGIGYEIRKKIIGICWFSLCSQ
jgi:hypothetical protein